METRPDSDDDDTETKTEYHYRLACDKTVDRIGSVVQMIRDAGRVTGGLEDRYGDILCDLAEIQGFLFRVCSAGVKKDKDKYLELLIEDYKEISK